jgi:hypothetical protein
LPNARCCSPVHVPEHDVVAVQVLKTVPSPLRVMEVIVPDTALAEASIEILVPRVIMASSAGDRIVTMGADPEVGVGVGVGVGV